MLDELCLELFPIYQSIVASGLQKLGVQVSGSDVPAVNVSMSPVDGVLA